LAGVSLTAPPLPSGAVALDVLYRRTGATDFIIGNQITSAISYAVSIDDLSVGESYQFAARGISFSGALSPISTLLTQAAPSNTTPPAAPTGATISKDGVKPKYFPGTKVFLFGTRVGWSPNAEKDFSHFEVKATLTNSDAATDFTWTAYDGVNNFVTTSGTETFLYNALLQAGFVRIRAVNRSGVQSTWTSVGNANAAGNFAIGTGDVSAQDSNDVSTTGIKTGGGASTRQINVIFSESVVATLAGGAASETFETSLTNRGFSAKPDIGIAQCASDGNISAAYDFDAAGNSSVTAVIRVSTIDGSNISAGNYRFSVEFTDFT